ncbi:MAG: HAD family hydrolase [Chloroflexi bacterium]|nr:HAD family hydrolase [Chloroflexota bacterium]
MKFDLIAFDGDDTLWHNEILYAEAQDKLKELLSSYADGETVAQRLYQTEMSNLQYYGYGIKSFTLSMIQTAVELTRGKIQAAEILQIIGFAKEMLTSEVQLVEHAAETIRELAKSYELMMITKGDLLDQQSKLSRSGLGDSFRYVEVVSQKTQRTYETLLAKYRIEPQRFLMVGNSLKSDILPVLALGGYAVYIPYHIIWAHETVDSQHVGHDRFYELEHLGQLPPLIEHLVVSL